MIRDAASQDPPAPSLESQVRALNRRLFWTELWLGVLISGLLGGSGLFWGLRTIQADGGMLRASGKMGGDLRLQMLFDSPVIVTHLLGPSPDDSAQAIAELPRPLVIADSGGGIIEAPTLKRLVWRSRATGETLRPPPPGARLTACFYRLEFSEPRRLTNP